MKHRPDVTFTLLTKSAMYTLICAFFIKSDILSLSLFRSVTTLVQGG
jgi:hypothetical protein